MPDQKDAEGLHPDDKRFKALSHFKDWSNYLLVTTVAAVGWVAQSKTGDQLLLSLAVWCLGVSLIFGILTLALVPLVAQQVDRSHSSIYKVPVSFRLLLVPCTAYLTQACRPQHLLFIAGVGLYCAAVTTEQQVRLTIPLDRFVADLVLAAILVGVASRPWGKK